MKGKERGKFLLSLNIIDSLSLLINNRTQLGRIFMKWFTPFKGLCYLDVEDEIDETLNHVSIKGANKFWDQTIINDEEKDDGIFPYIVRLTLQDFDEFHSDTQAGFYKKNDNHF